MYERVKKLYLEERINEYGLDNAIKFGWITEEQKQEIMQSKGLEG